MQSEILKWDFLKMGQLSHYRYRVCRFLWPIRLMPSRALPFKQKTKIAFEKTGLIHKACMEFMEASFKIEFQSCMCSETKSLLAESFYNVKYGSSIIMSESLSENLSNENKHSVFPVHFGILIHVLS